MLYDIAHFWVALLLAVALGAAVGWFSRSDEPRHGPVLVIGRGWIFWAAVVFVVGLALALLHALPDRPGLWLETALLLFVAYLVGCPLAALLPSGAGERSTAHRPPAAAPVRPAGNEAVPTSTGGGRPGAGPIVAPTATMPAKPVIDPATGPVATPGKGAAPVAAIPAGSIARPAADRGIAPGMALGGDIAAPTPLAPASVEPIADPAVKPAATFAGDPRPPVRRTTGIISDDPDAVDKPKR